MNPTPEQTLSKDMGQRDGDGQSASFPGRTDPEVCGANASGEVESRDQGPIQTQAWWPRLHKARRITRGSAAR